MDNENTLTQNAPAGGGDMAEQMVAEMNAATSTAPAAAPAEPTAKPATETAPAAKPETPEEKPASTPASTSKVAPAVKPAAAPAKPVAPVLDWKTAPKQFKEAHEALKSRFESTERELKGKVDGSGLGRGGGSCQHDHDDRLSHAIANTHIGPEDKAGIV